MLLRTVQNTRRSANRRAGFTLLEVLVVVAILVILAGTAAISVFRYLEDAKVGRAKNDMLAIKKAYETFYTQQFRWPEDPSEVIPLLEQGPLAFESPWKPNAPYYVTIEPFGQPDGTSIDRVVVHCDSPKGPITVPDLNQGR